MMSKMSEQDKQEFDFDPRKFVYKDFAESYHLGMRKYLLKQDPSTIPACAEHMKKLKMRHNLLKATTAVISLLVVGKIGQKIISKQKEDQGGISSDSRVAGLKKIKEPEILNDPKPIFG
jgi:fatty acyl-CoA reductase